MKKYALLTAFFFFCTLLIACGAKDGDGSTWQGIVPGMDDLTTITERTEYFDIAVESEDIFNLGLQEKNPQGQALDYAMIFGATVYMPVGTQFLMGEPVQLWAEACEDKANIYSYRKDGLFRHRQQPQDFESGYV